MAETAAYQFSDCDLQGRYRYSLTATTSAPGAARLVVVQCNPSLADGQRSDPTAGKVARWAQEQGFAEVEFLNLFARIGEHPEALRHLRYAQLVGTRNDQVIAGALAKAGTTLVLAWGARLPVGERAYRRRKDELRDLVTAVGRQPHHVGALTAGRYPRHGRMWNGGNRGLAPLDWDAIA